MFRALCRHFRNVSPALACFFFQSVSFASDAAKTQPVSEVQMSVVPTAELKLKADAGNARAAYTLGIRYFLGEQAERSRADARLYLTRAAEAGDPRAMNMLGLMSDPLWTDDESAKDLSAAVLWYKRAGALGYEASLMNLSELRRRGLIAGDNENLKPLSDAMSNARALPIPPLPLSAPALAPLAVQPSATAPAALPDARDVFKLRGSALVEIIGDGNYGSGVIVGSFKNHPEHSTLTTAVESAKVSYAFAAAAGKNPSDGVLPAGTYLLLISNAHVMEGTQRMEIGFGVDESGRTLFRKPVAGVCFPSEGNLDLAVYFVPVSDAELARTGSISFAPLRASASPADTGSRVFAIANPERMARSIAQGLLNGIRPDLLQFDAPISKGSSGGALFDERGDLLGIILGYLNEVGAQNLNFAIPVEKIRPLMAGAGSLCYRAAPPESPDPASAAQ